MVWSSDSSIANARVEVVTVALVPLDDAGATLALTPPAIPAPKRSEEETWELSGAPGILKGLVVDFPFKTPPAVCPRGAVVRTGGCGVEINVEGAAAIVDAGATGPPNLNADTAGPRPGAAAGTAPPNVKTPDAFGAVMVAVKVVI